MNLKMLVAVGVIVSFKCGTLAGNGIWNYGSTATPDGRTPMTPANWADPANWINAELPSGDNVVAYLVDPANPETDPKMAATLRYIRVPDAGMTLGGINSRSGVQLFVTGGPIALTDEGIAGSGWAWMEDRPDYQNVSRVVFFNDITFRSAYLGRCVLAGTVRPATPSAELIPTAQFCLVPYLQAKTDSETIVDPAYNGRFRPSTNGSICYYAPKGADEASGRWKVTAGSCVLERVGTAHDLAAGQHVTGAGIPDGAFVSRIYSASLVEISAPATASSEGGEGTELTFAAFSPVVRQTIAAMELQGDGWLSFSPMKLRPQDDVVYTVDYLKNTPSQAYEVATDNYADRFNVLPGGKVYPARTVFKNVDSSAKPFRLVRADVMFENDTSVTTACARVHVGGRGSGLSVAWPTGGVTVAVSPGKVTHWASFEQFEGALTKTGAGELSIVPACSLDLGHLVVNEGRVSLSGDATARTLASLRVSPGAALSVAEGQNLAVRSTSFASGSSIHVARGARLELAAGTSLDGVTVTGDGSVVVGSYGTDVAQMDSGSPVASGSQVVPGVRGTPAFWVTADSLAAETPAGTLEQVGDTLEVLRWNDCRSAAEGGVMFATNRTLRPFLASDKGHAYVRFGGCGSLESNHGLIWDRQLPNIRSVFVVLDTTEGYFGSILGSSSRWEAFDFVRAGLSSNGGLFFDAGSEPWRCSSFIADPRAVCYLNGKELPSHTTNIYEALGNRNGIAVIEVEPTGDCRADAFCSCPETGTWGGRWDLVGGERLLECIVYTNTLSYVDRYCTHAYLMQKYGLLPSRTNDETFHNDKRTRVNGFAPSAGACGQVKVEDGCSATLPSVPDGVGLEKTGSGTLYVSEAKDTRALNVRSGTLVVRSADLSAAALLPQDAALRFDASDLTSITYGWDAERGLNTITKWTDVVNGIEATLKVVSTTNRPFVLENALNGKPVVDFGRAMANISQMDANPNPGLLFAPQYALKTVFSVIGSERGGNTLLGGSSGRQDSYGQRQSNKTTLGIWRDVQGHPGDLTRPIVETDGSAINGEFTSFDKLQVRQNGTVVDQTKALFSGAYDLFTLNANTENMESSVLGAVHYANNAGGMQLAETIFYKRNLDLVEIQGVEAYLDYKWFNRRHAGYSPASAEVVDVAAGAVLRVEGGAPLTVKSLSVAGTVEGSLRLADASALTVTVNDDGTIEPIVVSGTVDLSAGGTVVLVGATDKLGVGSYELLRTGAPLALDEGAWTLAASALNRKLVTALKCVGGSLYLDVSKRGFAITIR